MATAISSSPKIQEFYLGSKVITCPYCGAKVKCNAIPIYILPIWKNFKCPKCGNVIIKMPQGSNVELATPVWPPEEETPTPVTTPPGEGVPSPSPGEVPKTELEKFNLEKYLPYIILVIILIFMGRE